MEETDSNILQEPLLQNEVAMEGADSKVALKQEQRERVANKIMERLKMCIPLSGQDGLQELGKIAVRLEEKIYAEAASQTDYLRKMMKLKANSKTSMAYSLNSNASSSENAQDPASQIMQSQILNQGQQLPTGMVFDQPQVQQHFLPQNIQNNNASTVVLNPAGLTPSTTQSYMQPQQKQNLLQPNQPMSQPLMSLNQSRPGQLQQQLYLQQQSNTLPKNCQQSLQSTGSVLQPQCPINQQKQLFQFQSQSERGYSKLKKKTVTALKKMHAVQQPQMSSNEGQVNAQTQSMNIQSSMVMPTQQHNTLSSASSVSNSSPNMLGELQSGSNIDPGQSNVLNQTQQVATNFLQQNLVGGSQPLSRSISSQNGLTALQSNASSLLSNSNAVQPQQINPLHHLSLNQQLMQQQYQHAQMVQQQYMQKLLLQQTEQQQIMHRLIQQQQQQRQQQLMQHLVQKQHQQQQQTLQKQSALQLIQQQQQTLQKQSAQQLIQQQQQTFQKQSEQQLIQKQPQTFQKQSEQQLIQKQPPAPQQQQQTSQKQSVQHVIQLQEQTSEKSPGQKMPRITAFLKLVCQLLFVVLLVMLMIQTYDA